MSDIRSGKVSTPISSHRAGLFLVTTSPWYGHGSQLFFDYEILGLHGGFAHCPDGTPLYYNRGNDGPLGWHWYWWTDD